MHDDARTAKLRTYNECCNNNICKKNYDMNIVRTSIYYTYKYITGRAIRHKSNYPPGYIHKYILPC